MNEVAWNILISAVSAGATLAAVIVALYQTKIAYKKKLRLRFHDNIKLDVTGLSNFLYRVGVSVANIGNKKVKLKQIYVRVSDGIVVFFTHDIKYTPTKFPVEVEPDDSITIYIELDKFILNIKEDILTGGVKKNEKITLFIEDSVCKQYKVKSKMTYAKFLEKYDKKVTQ